MNYKTNEWGIGSLIGRRSMQKTEHESELKRTNRRIKSELGNNKPEIQRAKAGNFRVTAQAAPVTKKINRESNSSNRN